MRRLSKWLSKFIRAPPPSNTQLAHYPQNHISRSAFNPFNSLQKLHAAQVNALFLQFI